MLLLTIIEELFNENQNADSKISTADSISRINSALQQHGMHDPSQSNLTDVAPELQGVARESQSQSVEEKFGKYFGYLARCEKKPVYRPFEIEIFDQNLMKMQNSTLPNFGNFDF